MAVIKAVSSKAGIGHAIDYVTKKEKTEEKLVSGLHCEPETVKEEMQATKELWGKTDGRTYKHYVQSYHEDEEITPEQAHKNAIELAEHTKAWKRRAWSMSLREMHEQQKQSSPREQLQELNRQSRTELENSLLKEALAMSSENCEELMKQSNQEQVRAEQNRQRDAEQNRKLISELKQSVELLKNSNELLQDAISGEIGSLKDEVKENTVQEVRKALQANIEAIQRATKLLEKQSDTLTSVMKQKLRELEESKNSFFRYEGLKLYLFWGGMVCNILVFLMLASSMFGR